MALLEYWWLLIIATSGDPGSSTWRCQNPYGSAGIWMIIDNGDLRWHRCGEERTKWKCKNVYGSAGILMILHNGDLRLHRCHAEPALWECSDCCICQGILTILDWVRVRANLNSAEPWLLERGSLVFYWFYKRLGIPEWESMSGVLLWTHQSFSLLLTFPGHAKGQGFGRVWEYFWESWECISSSLNSSRFFTTTHNHWACKIARI